jgi:hypothetical protein
MSMGLLRPFPPPIAKSTRNMQPNFRTSFSGIGVVWSDGINREVSDPRVSSIRPIFVAALAAAMLPACTQSCDTLSSGQQFPLQPTCSHIQCRYTGVTGSSRKCIIRPSPWFSAASSLPTRTARIVRPADASTWQEAPHPRHTFSRCSSAR